MGYIVSVGKKGRRSIEELKRSFDLLRSKREGERLILAKENWRGATKEQTLGKWLAFSRESESVYPGQGLLLTPYDYLDVRGTQMLPQEAVVKSLRLRNYFLELFNHPYRLHFLDQVSREKFIPPKKIESVVMDRASEEGLAVSVGDLGAAVTGAGRARVSRTERYATGPFVKLGKQARAVFVGSASPDVWNSAAAVATMAASHCLAGIPRNGLLSDISRQADLAHETFEWLEVMAEDIFRGRSEKKKILMRWRKNVLGTLEASPEKALVRAKALFSAGVTAFRVYSPEPGTGAVETVAVLRKKYGDEIELFAGQVISLDQAKELERAGADGLFVGIGGGGRCITGVRSGSAIDWPELVWQLRGEVGISVVAEGGASDHIAVTLLLGASGISVSRMVAGGTIESPGGALYCVDEMGKLFKPYGGEASARTKFLDGKVLPFDIPSFVEGETTRAQMSYVKFVYPTLTYNLHLLFEDAILALVFRGVEDIAGLQKINPSPLRRITPSGDFQRQTH